MIGSPPNQPHVLIFLQIFKEKMLSQNALAGGHIDHNMYVMKEAAGKTSLERYTPFYSDHDALCLTLALGVEEVLRC